MFRGRLAWKGSRLEWSRVGHKPLHTALWWPCEVWHECFRAALPCPPKKPTFKRTHFHSSVVRANQILQDSVFGVPSGETHCLYHNTVGHFPSALFWGVFTEPPSQTPGPQQRTGGCCQGPCSGRVGTCWVPLSASQLCGSTTRDVPATRSLAPPLENGPSALLPAQDAAQAVLSFFPTQWVAYGSQSVNIWKHKEI